MRNALIYTAALASAITFGTASVAIAEVSKDTAKSGSEMMMGEGMHMMDGNKMPMMGMMQEMNSMMKNCNEMMENMNKQMSKEAGQGDSKAQ
ncbi:hypothetical protein ACEPUI_32265 [Pseudomonas aeruginosa]|uniref:hypothetical protein n=1 Tax=Pseudomonas aeruginosa TaxID=287 RepID=UPI0011CC644A|nr:hypothetical protein [Pseudomonas mendocina]TXR38310.1 hypothetical protein FVE88_15345 [Pseudomonas mendocina]